MLNRSRNRVRRRSILMGLAIFATCMLAAFRFDSSGAHWLWADAPAGAVACAIIAAACWLGTWAVPNPLRHR